MEKGRQREDDDRLRVMARSLLGYECISEAAQKTPTSTYHEGILRVAAEDAIDEGENTTYVPCRFQKSIGACGVLLTVGENEAQYSPVDCPFETEAE